MRCKLLTAAVMAIGIVTTGCSTLEKVVYRPDINRVTIWSLGMSLKCKKA